LHYHVTEAAADQTVDRSYPERRYAMLFLPKQEGQGLVEYALILILVAIIVIVILAILGPQMGNIFSNVVSHI
jgi:pilus assembly protein Flp/PilA